MPKFSVRSAIIPDGTGGVLFAGVTPGAAEVIFGSGGVQYNSPVGPVDQMLLGENDTVFAAGAFSGVTALNLQTGSPIWQRPDAADLTAALADGRLVVDDFGAGVLTSIDATGQATPLFVPSSGGASALTFGSGSYYSFGGWAGALDFQRFALAYDKTVDIAASGYAEMGMNPRKNNAKRTRDFQLIWLNSFCFYKDYPQIDESTRQDLTGHK